MLDLLRLLGNLRAKLDLVINLLVALLVVNLLLHLVRLVKEVKGK